jgi:predicted small metal-binding protein
MTKTLACGDIMDGCSATFEGATDDEILAQAGPHAVNVHGIEITPEVVEMVRSHIKETDSAS